MHRVSIVYMEKKEKEQKHAVKMTRLRMVDLIACGCIECIPPIPLKNTPPNSAYLPACIPLHRLHPADNHNKYPADFALSISSYLHIECIEYI